MCPVNFSDIVKEYEETKKLHEEFMEDPMNKNKDRDFTAMNAKTYIRAGIVERYLENDEQRMLLEKIERNLIAMMRAVCDVNIAAIHALHVKKRAN